METLNQYPELIANAATDVAQCDRAIAQLKQAISRLETDAELNVVFDTELKNEGQRKARKAQILEHSDHPVMTTQLLDLEADRRSAQIMLERYRNEFTVAKLEAQLTIAGADF